MRYCNQRQIYLVWRQMFYVFSLPLLHIYALCASTISETQNNSQFNHTPIYWVGEKAWLEFMMLLLIETYSFIYSVPNCIDSMVKRSFKEHSTH